jgi:parvulin-like peptidyl-prolyl isomerase
LAGVLLYGCAGDQEKKIENEDELAARVEDWTLTKDFLYNYIDQLPQNQKEKYDSPRGRAQLTSDIMADEMYYLEARKLNMKDEDDVKAELDKATRAILISAYFKKYIEAKARPSEEEMLDYYHSHEDVYTSLPARRAQHIFSKDRDKLVELKKRFEAGELLTTLATKYSEDRITRDDGGNMGYFNPGGYIRGVGFSEVLNDTIFKMDGKKLYGPIKWEKGYSLVYVNEIRPPVLKPFDEVKDQISDILTAENIERIRRQVNEKIKGHYDTRNYMEEFYNSIQRTPEELFQYAQTTSDPYDRIRAFEEIVEKFPEDNHAPQAMFMVGFVYLEELKDENSAKHNFKQVLTKYPDSDVADSAQWMLDNLDKPLPEFENIEDLNKKLSDG